MTFFKTGEIEGVAQPDRYSDLMSAPQNNFIVLPDSVVGVNQVLAGCWSRVPVLGLAGGVVPYGAMVVGNLFGMGTVGGIGFDISSYYSMQSYLATMRWTLFNPPAYSNNKRTHRLSAHQQRQLRMALLSVVASFWSVTSRLMLTCMKTFGMTYVPEASVYCLCATCLGT